MIPALLALFGPGFGAAPWAALGAILSASLPVSERPPPADVAPLIEHAIGGGVDYLLRSQNPDGSWGSARRTKDLNIYAPSVEAHHGYRAGTTALCLLALLELQPSGEAARAAIDRAAAWILRELPKLRRSSADVIYNVWGHAYGIQALALLRQRHPDDLDLRRRIDEVLRGQIDLLARYECLDGGWCYYDFEGRMQHNTGSTISFVTATVLVALGDARETGAAMPRRIIDRAIASIHRQEKPDFSYLYGEYLRWRPQRLVNRPAGSLGRSQACNLALRMWGYEKMTDKVLQMWVKKLLDRNLWLDIGRKRPIPHESWAQVAGYFYYYGHYYGARCLELLPAADRPPLAARLALVLISHQEKDGSWFDYPLYDYHQPYGTAYALMALRRCRAGAGRE